MLVAAVGIGGVVVYVQSVDTARPGARAFAASAPEVVARVGVNGTTRVPRFTYVGRRNTGYRDYSVLVASATGDVHVVVRAHPEKDLDAWRYEIVSIN